MGPIKQTLPIGSKPRAAVGTAVFGSQAFQRLVLRRRLLVLCAATFALGFYMLQVALSVFTQVLDGFAFGPFSWGWVFSFGQFVVPLMLLHLYLRCSAMLDAQAAAIERDDV
jgi:uncharacterized membrane protein (DUF485 family)